MESQNNPADPVHGGVPEGASQQKSFPYNSILTVGIQGSGTLYVPSGLRLRGKWSGAIIVASPQDANEPPGEIIIDKEATFEGIIIGFQVRVIGAVRGYVIAREFLEVGATGQISDGAFYAKWRCDDGSDVGGKVGKISPTTDIQALVHQLAANTEAADLKGWLSELKI